MINIKDILRRSHERFIDHPFQTQHVNMLRREVMGCRSLLDLGCGNGSHIRGITPYLVYSMGVDAYSPSLNESRSQNIYTKIKRMDVRDIGTVFRGMSFDCVLAFDLLEHLEKAEGFRLIEAMERIASIKVIIFTPNGYVPQGPISNNKYQIHRSGWKVAEMKSFGYRVKGVHGIKVLLGEGSRPRWRPNRLWKLISVLTQPLCLHIPELAFQLFCVKNMTKYETKTVNCPGRLKQL